MPFCSRARQGKDSGVFDQKRLYPKELEEANSFRSWSEHFIAWLSMDNEEVARTFVHAGKQEQALDTSGLSELQLAYSKAVYGHLVADRELQEGSKGCPAREGG